MLLYTPCTLPRSGLSNVSRGGGHSVLDHKWRVIISVPEYSSLSISNSPRATLDNTTVYTLDESAIDDDEDSARGNCHPFIIKLMYV